MEYEKYIKHSYELAINAGKEMFKAGLGRKQNESKTVCFEYSYEIRKEDNNVIIAVVSR